MVGRNWMFITLGFSIGVMLTLAVMEGRKSEEAGGVKVMGQEAYGVVIDSMQDRVAQLTQTNYIPIIGGTGMVEVVTPRLWSSAKYLPPSRKIEFGDRISCITHTNTIPKVRWLQSVVTEAWVQDGSNSWKTVMPPIFGQVGDSITIIGLRDDGVVVWEDNE